MDGYGYCYGHRPDLEEERRRSASRAGKRGGRGRSRAPIKEIADLKAQLEDLAEDVLEGRRDKGVAVVVNQILNTRLRAIELERKIKETEELEERLEALERTATGGTDRPWGA